MPVFGDDIDPSDWDEASGQCCLNLVHGGHLVGRIFQKVELLKNRKELFCEGENSSYTGSVREEMVRRVGRQKVVTFTVN